MNRFVLALKHFLFGSVDHLVADLNRGVAKLEKLAERKADAAEEALAESRAIAAKAKEHAAEAARASRVASNIKQLVA